MADQVFGQCWKDVRILGLALPGILQHLSRKVPDRVVVLGGNGFIGKRVVAALQASGWAEPIIATRRAVSAPPGIEQVRVDATQEGDIARAAQNALGIVNCVTGDPTTILANARALCTAATRCAVPRVVYLSSMAVYASAAGNVDESAPLIGDGTPYGRAKISAESIVSEYPGAVILRPGIVYGPHSDEWSLQIGRLVRQRRLGDLGVHGNGTCNLLYVEDMATAVSQTLRKPEMSGRIFNLAMSNPPTWSEYFERYATALGVTSIPKISPLRLAAEVHALGPILRLLELVGGGSGFPVSPAIRPWLIRLCERRIRLEVTAAETALGMTWTSIDSGIEATAAWFHQATTRTDPPA
jgi:nucleoside-diphosphate-sugar epimerase